MIKSYFSSKTIISLSIFLLFLCNPTSAFSYRNYAQNSVLYSGNWVKIKVGDTGIYKLTYENLKNMGFENPQNIQVFGYGGNILSENFSLNDYIDDLPQVTIWMSSPKESFGVNDYILFYGIGSIKWTYYRNEFIQTQNPYSSEGYYFLTESEDKSKVAKMINSDPDNSVATITTFQDCYLHEKELVNISQSGRHFYGESFNEQKKQTFNFPLEGIVSGSNATISYEFISYPKKRPDVTNPDNANLQVTLNGINTRSKNIETPGNSYTVATTVTDSYSQIATENNSLIFNYTNRSGNDINTHLNYFRVNYTKNLQPYGAVTLFRSISMSSKQNYSIANAPQNCVVFDVTDAANMTVMVGKKENNSYQFSAPNSTIREYALADLSKDIPSPTFVKRVDSQNLHAMEGAEMIIIVQPELREYAERLARIHQENSGLETLIVHPEDIFNEFSSGTPDATAYRSFLKMLYDQAHTLAERPKYLLLFGDGTFDNRFLSDNWKNVDTSNFLLTYQSENSTSEVNSYVSDDYFGFLDDNEGSNLKNDKLDLGIGRLPVRTKLEAHNVVEKINRYINNEGEKSWQNNILFIADDAIGSNASDSKSERVHMEHSDGFANDLNKNYPDFRTTKLYMDSYERLSIIPGKPRYIEGKAHMLDAINSGALILNFMGHGSQFDWTHEFILTEEDVVKMKNKALPLWITATCDFSRFDYNATSTGELALLNPDGGAIALFSTVRVVFASSNKLINASMFEHLFTEENDQPLRLGDIIRYAKTRSSSTSMATDANKLRFQLLGDPALRLNTPSSKHQVKIETINGSNPTETVQFETMSKVTVKGSIVDENGNIDSSFNGYIETTAFDNEQNMRTRGQVKSGSSITSEELALNYVDYVNKIFSGKTKINNGNFEFSFVVPKDIFYSDKNGKMFFVAYDSSNNNSAKGSYSNYKIEKGNNIPEKENIPPIINNLYINDGAFTSGETIANQSVLFAEISDNTGLNLSEGLGHGIKATINGVAYDITSSFITNGQSSQSGKIEYRLPILPAGKYTLTLKVWDVWNNSTTKSINFIIDKKDNLTYTFDLNNKIAQNQLKFIFSTESTNSDISISYKIYDKSTNLKWIHEVAGKSSTFENYTYNWDLIGNDGLKLKPGSYSCVVKIKIGHIEEEKNYDFVIL